MTKKRKLTKRQATRAMFQVAATTYRAAPAAVVVKFIGMVVTSILPLVTTYYAALTTTALAEAYAGDEGAGGRAITYVIITAALGVGMSVWSSIAQYIDQLTRYKIEAAVSDQMYERFLGLEFWRYDDKKTADLYDRASRFSRIFPYVFDTFASMATSVFTVVASAIALSVVSWWITLIILVAVIPSAIIQIRLSRKQSAHWNDHVESRRMKGMIEYSMFEPKYIAELRLYGMVRHLLDLRVKLRDKDEKVQIDFERSFIVKRLGADVLEAAAEVVALLYITFQIIGRAQPIGQFLYVQQITSRALGSAQSFVSQLGNIDEELANLIDYQEFMELPFGYVGTKKLQGAPGEISLQNVSFGYPESSRQVLHDISLTINKSQHVAIVGENGAGKSTLVKILTGLYQPTEGTVTLDGVNLQEIDVSTWHRQLGVLQQDYLSYGFATAKDNIVFGDVAIPFSTERFNEAIKRAEAGEFLEKLPKGVDSYILNWMEHSDGTKGEDLSGGQWQRLALARNFYRNSSVIILDEPTSAIDALAESRIFKRLFSDKNRTVIAISHRVTTIERADMIYMLEGGRIVEQGTHKELVKRRGAYFTMFASQLHIDA